MSNKPMIVYGLGLVAIVLELVAIIEPNWSKKSGSEQGVSLKVNMGLWKECAKGSMGAVNIDKCVHIPSGDNKNLPKHSLEACRVFSILGVVLVFAAMLCMYFCKVHPRVQVALLVAGGLCSILASIIWAAELLKYKDSTNVQVKLDPDYGLYLNAVGGVCALVAAGYLGWAK